MREQVNDFLRKSLTRDARAGHQLWGRKKDDC